MKHYSQKRKDAVLKRMMQPENAPVPMLAEETGISKVTLYDWRKHAIAKGLVVPEDTHRIQRIGLRNISLPWCWRQR